MFERKPKKRIKEFSSTESAYDASNSTLPTGLVLLIPSERVIGVSDTWPIAVTVEKGAFHSIKPGYDWRHGFEPQLVEGLEYAIRIAKRLGVPLDPVFA